ncbi:N-6 DNA methylase [Natroniella sp. ANB-PHB2]|uniref:type I restriction-modification system subunit M n=1 Tax=Natroniella sp. ANB-PHB2 TaxID=3384444 RepID=UPI0038D4A0E3
MTNFGEKINFIWNIANLLRGPYKQERYGDVILPMAVLRRFDCLLEDSKEEVLEKAEEVDIDKILNKITGYNFNNTSVYDFDKLLDDPDNIAENLRAYIRGFTPNIREIIENFDFDKEISKLDKNNLLYLVIKEFNKIDLHPDVVANQEMGYIFEELIRRFSENADAGDHYTPREVIRLMVNLLLTGEEDELTNEGNITTVGDFACGTGGMLSEMTKYITEMNPNAQVEVFGQEINPQSYAICKSDILIKGQNAGNIVLGNSFTEDGHQGLKVRYGIMNPPFGVSWRKYSKEIKNEHKELGFDGRFGAGTPRTSDGSLLFLQHLISKMKDDEKGSRIAIVFNGSPLFTGDAGSGESEIRRWIIENDLLEGIVALPENLFYNTGIATYIWILSNRKNDNLETGAVRKDKIQLVDATEFYENMRKSLGEKRHKITDEQIDEITRIYGDFKENEYCKIFDKEEFGYLKVRVERPLKLNFKITEDRIENIYSENTFNKLFDEEKYQKLAKLSEAPEFSTKQEKKLDKLKQGRELQEKILARLRENTSDKLYKNRKEFKKVLKEILGDLDLKRSLFKAVYNGLSKRDESANYCMKGGKKQHDTDLRDYERIDLSQKVEEYKEDTSDFVEGEKENITAYFEREVKPHVPEAWVDYSYTRVGYEIPFTRYFYEFEELESSAKIKEEIEEIESEIQGLMKQVLELGDSGGA